MKKILLFVSFLCTSLFSYELAILTMFRNEANYLKEWIEYHRMVGVDHFLLYNDRSEDHWAEVLEPYIQSGLVEVIEWNKPEGTPLFPGWQTMAYKDGLARAKGNTKWMAFIDIDEFILPKKNRTVIECLNEYYSQASGVYICWRNFGTGNVYINPGEPILTQLIHSSNIRHPRNASGKSIVLVDDVDLADSWSPHQFVLRRGAVYLNGSGKPLSYRGADLQVDPSHTSRYIQINHYAMRDENFYQKVRLPKAISKEYGELHLLKEHYTSFNREINYQMVEFLRTMHPDHYKRFWSR